MHAKSILITGASSGIGAALAKTYAVPGNHLALWGRNTVRLNAIADACRTGGASVECVAIDLSDVQQFTNALDIADRRTPFDLVIFNAGLGGALPDTAVAQEADAATKMAIVNFVVPTVGANLIADRMATRLHGHIVLVGSVAEAFSLPMSPLYSGTKAGLATFAEALQLRLRKHQVDVSIVIPGFIDTPMSQSLSQPRPFLLSADAAAKIIAARIERRVRRIILPWQFRVVLAVSRVLPRFLLRTILAQL